MSTARRHHISNAWQLQSLRNYICTWAFADLSRCWGKFFCIKMYWAPAKMLLLADVDEYSFINTAIKKRKVFHCSHCENSGPVIKKNDKKMSAIMNLQNIPTKMICSPEISWCQIYNYFQVPYIGSQVFSCGQVLQLPLTVKLLITWFHPQNNTFGTWYITTLVWWLKKMSFSGLTGRWSLHNFCCLSVVTVSMTTWWYQYSGWQVLTMGFNICQSMIQSYCEYTWNDQLLWLQCRHTYIWHAHTHTHTCIHTHTHTHIHGLTDVDITIHPQNILGELVNTLCHQAISSQVLNILKKQVFVFHEKALKLPFLGITTVQIGKTTQQSLFQRLAPCRSHTWGKNILLYSLPGH